ncbi:hypothetical protein FOVG_19405 [Fusarium oxysporum f. sp. pisi HDV247]|uniref:Zn(2)-C6 fungal-type domain-containing protein n=1 Tax=Fusarium oxysporum f. sp. pisi HDV247 TaxID=1080344 RepID=W9N8S1_FUSOX|nr:hypothetical protein FOVG_19405 [Fusarium oxysporum f. sp. pisi HDV247]EXA29030.1 hypothetical protein FOVG_19405 [Fusarium oxysporum f. sp. pisi HDV247]
MRPSSFASPPIKAHESTLSRRSTSSSTKSVKPMHRTSKQASPSAGIDSRYRRAWKACERCRMKKAKCDGEFPCKRCKDDDLVCAAGIRKKMKYKKLSQGYAEILENTQFALIVTIHKLYFMVRNNQPWELGDPELNDRGQPVIHNIVQKLGCIRADSDIDLPIDLVFPKDQAGIAKLAHQLEEQQKENKDRKEVKDADSSIYNHTQRASLSELDPPGCKHDYQAAFSSNDAIVLSPQSFTSSSGLDFAPPPPGTNPSAMFPSLSPSIPSFSSWSSISADTQPSHLTMHFLQRPSVPGSMDILGQGLVESELGTIDPHILSCPNLEVMMGMGDPMVYSGYDSEPILSGTSSVRYVMG